MNVVTVVCGTVEAGCVCVELPDHDGAHVCKCGGSWSVDPDGTFRVHAMPQPLSPSEAIAYPCIESLEELDALPLWSVVLADFADHRPDVWQRLKSGRERTIRDWTMVNDDGASFCTADLPALVLWTPEGGER